MSKRFIWIMAGLLVVAGLALYMAGSLLRQLPASQPATAPPAASAPPGKPLIITTPTPSARPKPGAPVTTPEPTPDMAPTKGTLLIESDVPDTSVFIDRVYLGTAPITAKDLTPGPHRLNLSATGYEGVAETIDIEAGTHTYSAKFKEIRLDEKIEVTHKHAMGSCAGTLRATPQGLTYDTTNKGDAFSVPLTNLETFEIDYIQKNLKVKIRGGKAYNFTDAQGNADRLYVFQQTVEKVRQRLSRGGASPLPHHPHAVAR